MLNLCEAIVRLLHLHQSLLEIVFFFGAVWESTMTVPFLKILVLRASALVLILQFHLHPTRLSYLQLLSENLYTAWIMDVILINPLEI